VFIILKQSINTVKEGTVVNMHNQKGIIGMETDAVCVPQECEPQVNHILRWFLWWCFWYIFFCAVLHTLNGWDCLIYCPVCLQLCIC